MSIQLSCVNARIVGRHALCSESDNTRSREESNSEVPREISTISRSSSGVIFGPDARSVSETPKPLVRLVIDPYSVVGSSPALR